jgi:hypothetical protein
MQTDCWRQIGRWGPPSDSSTPSIIAIDVTSRLPASHHFHSFRVAELSEPHHQATRISENLSDQHDFPTDSPELRNQRNDGITKTKTTWVKEAKPTSWRRSVP